MADVYTTGGRQIFATGREPRIAAFGIAQRLWVTTVREGKRSVVELTRAEIESVDVRDGVSVPAHEREQPTDEANGTLIEIEVELTLTPARHACPASARR